MVITLSKGRVPDASLVNLINTKILDMEFEEAVEYVTKLGFTIRKANIDGHTQTLTRDFKLNRVNVDIEHDKIVAVRVG